MGIESPGITCALPLARRAVAKLVEKEKPKPNLHFDPVRKTKKRFLEMDEAERAAAIAAEIEALREPYRLVCRLCLLEEKSPEETALALGRPVKRYIHSSRGANGCCGRNWKGAEDMERFRADGHLTNEMLIVLVQSPELFPRS